MATRTNLKILTSCGFEKISPQQSTQGGQKIRLYRLNSLTGAKITQARVAIDQELLEKGRTYDGDLKKFGEDIRVKPYLLKVGSVLQLVEGKATQTPGGIQHTLVNLSQSICNFLEGVTIGGSFTVGDNATVNIAMHVPSAKTQETKHRTPVVKLPPRDPKFSGRNEEIHQLSDFFGKHQRVAVTGLGGIGKSSLIIEYVHQHKSNYELIYFIDGSSPVTIKRGLLKLANELRLLGDAPAQQLRSLKVKLKEQPNSLLIFDGVDSENAFEYLEEHLPSQLNCVVTTRMAEVASNSHNFISMRLKVFSIDDALTYIDKQSEKNELAKSLAEKLGYLPLALAHACAYIRQRGITINRFLDNFKQKSTRLFNEPITKPTNQQTILTIWSMSLGQMSPETVELLSFCSFLAPARIPLSLLEKWTNSHYLVKDICELVKELKDYSIIDSDAGVEQYSVHSLLQQVIRDKLSQQDQTRMIKEILTFFTKNIPPLELSKKALTDIPYEWADHIEAILQHTSKASISLTKFENCYKLFELLGDRDEHLGSYEDANNNFTLALSYSKDEKARLCYKLGLSFRRFGNYKNSMEMFQKAQQHDSQKHYHRFIIYEIATLRHLQKHNDAESIYSKALMEFKKNHELDWYAKTQHQLGNVYIDLALKDKKLVYLDAARESFEQAVASFKEAGLGRSVEIAKTYFTQGNLCRYIDPENGIALAIKHYQRAQGIYKDHLLLNFDHPYILLCRYQLARCEEELGNIDGAYKTYRQLLGLYQKFFDPESEDLEKIKQSIDRIKKERRKAYVN